LLASGERTSSRRLENSLTRQRRASVRNEVVTPF
jgi:hypothetical protein